LQTQLQFSTTRLIVHLSVTTCRVAIHLEYFRITTILIFVGFSILSILLILANFPLSKAQTFSSTSDAVFSYFLHLVPQVHLLGPSRPGQLYPRHLLVLSTRNIPIRFTTDLPINLPIQPAPSMMKLVVQLNATTCLVVTHSEYL
jgi:hypothetical protein